MSEHRGNECQTQDAANAQTQGAMYARTQSVAKARTQGAIMPEHRNRNRSRRQQTATFINHMVAAEP